jgi:hypothetical protein
MKDSLYQKLLCTPFTFSSYYEIPQITKNQHLKWLQDDELPNYIKIIKFGEKIDYLQLLEEFES